MCIRDRLEIFWNINARIYHFRWERLSGQLWWAEREGWSLLPRAALPREHYPVYEHEAMHSFSLRLRRYFNHIPGVEYKLHFQAIMTVASTKMKIQSTANPVRSLSALRRSSNAPTIDAFRSHGNAIRTMTVQMAQVNLTVAKWTSKLSDFRRSSWTLCKYDLCSKPIPVFEWTMHSYLLGLRWYFNSSPKTSYPTFFRWPRLLWGRRRGQE